MSRLFPTLLIMLSVCAAAGYLPTGDWRRVVYWCSSSHGHTIQLSPSSLHSNAP